MNHPNGRRRMPIRGLAAWSGFGAGVGLLLVLLLYAGPSGISGWQPVNDALLARLSLSEADDPPPAPARSRSGSEIVGAGDARTAPEPSASGGSASAPAEAPSDDASPSAAVPSGDPPVSPPDDDARLDLNRATVAELDELPGIGPAKAQAIAELRDARRGFRDAEELLEVKGIGPKLYDKIRGLVKIDPPAAPGATGESHQEPGRS